MQERYLFRGKRLDNNEWVHGFYFHRATQHYIKYPSVRSGVDVLTDYEVDPSTVGQCTGLRDKTGKLIFEGDIVRGRAGEIYHGISEFDSEFVVEDGFTQSMWTMLQCDTLEIIGTIHTTPELMEGNDGTEVD